MNKKTVLTIILIVIITVIANAQQYDPESDFRIDWDTNANGGVMIAKYLGSKKEVRIPTSIQNNPVTGIGNEAFLNNKNIIKITIPNSVTIIHGGFSGCTSLTSVIIPNSVTEIGWNAFSKCTSLTSITIPDSVTEIGPYAFSGCTNLTNVIIPNNVTEIGWDAFSGCTSLTRINIPNGVTRISESTFSGCTSLTSITIPNSVTDIGNSAFSGCTSLASITISNNVTVIRERVFINCKNLANIIIPNRVTLIQHHAFSGCTNLVSVTFQVKIAEYNLAQNAFGSDDWDGIGDLRERYLASDGGPGTYTRFAGGKVWRKQQAITQPTTTQPTTTQQSATRSELPEPIGFVRINGGTFTMGSPANEPERGYGEIRHQVTVSSFYIGKYEVTQKEYQEVMGTNPSNFKGDNFPVENVSWYDAIEYCNKRSQKEGLTPAYTRNGDNVTWNRNANGYRLPTEAEWEYACRAGTITPFNTGNNITTSQANYNGNYPYNNNAKGEYREKTTPVGSFAPNSWGLYDMHGNVWEWCWDLFGDYQSGTQTDPVGAVTGSARVLRGGYWFYFGLVLRSAYRDISHPNYRYFIIGFRLVRS